MEPVTKNIGIHYGCMADDLKDQLTAQNLKFKAEDMDRYQKMIDGLNHMRMESVMIDSMYNKILPKLQKKIMQSVAKSNNMKLTKALVK